MQGSFGLWQPYAGIYLPTGKNMVVRRKCQATWAKGNYPYHIENGMFSQKEYRSNSDIQAFQGEINVVNRSPMYITLVISQTEGYQASIIFFQPWKAWISELLRYSFL